MSVGEVCVVQGVDIIIFWSYLLLSINKKLANKSVLYVIITLNIKEQSVNVGL